MLLLPGEEMPVLASVTGGQVMKIWEYKIEDFNVRDYDHKREAIEEAMNKLGNQSWEAVGIAHLPSGWIRVLFKRSG